MKPITLPVPPSTNALYRNKTAKERGTGRKKTEEYKAWIEHAGYVLNRQNVKPIKKPVKLHLLVEFNARRDLSNHLKAVEDLLVKHKIIPDDKMVWITFETLGSSKDIEGCQVTLTPETL